jgi:Ser/Thr protein kinase RdoA (MazF antagonist)
MVPDQIFALFVEEVDGYLFKPFGSGLIHTTYIVELEGKPVYILQHINKNVFKQPQDIAINLKYLEEYLEVNGIGFLVPFPIKTVSGETHAIIDGEFYRLTAFVSGTHSLDQCNHPDQAYEAALQFGRYTASFKNFDATRLIPSIPGFHDLAYRWHQFETVLASGNKDRILMAQREIATIKAKSNIVDRFVSIRHSSGFIQRVTHHDTKINNVLFDTSGKGVCVIDLDTTMSGLIISDLGDMFRTYLSPGNEEETNLQNVFVRKDFLEAIHNGYAEHMSDLMTDIEKDSIGYAGEFMIYMQALRFLTDFLDDDKYYGIRYEMNNYDRTVNQLQLLEDYQSYLH